MARNTLKSMARGAFRNKLPGNNWMFYGDVEFSGIETFSQPREGGDAGGPSHWRNGRITATVEAWKAD